MRLFFAIRIPYDFWNPLGLVQGRLPQVQGVRYSMAHDFHVTLKFLDECDSMKALEVAVSARAALKRVHFKPEDLELSFSRLKLFHKHHIPQVIYAGIRMSPVLYEFQQDLEASLESLGFKSEGKRFLPYVTLARVRDFKKHDRLGEWQEAFGRLGVQRKTFSIQGFDLIESQLEEGQVPIYKTIETFSFI